MNRPLAVLAATGIIFAAVYLLWMYQRVLFGDITHAENRSLPDLSAREWAVLMPVVALIVWIGVYPYAFTRRTEATLEALITQVQSKAEATRVADARRLAQPVIGSPRTPAAAERSQVVPTAGHPRLEPASRTPLQ